MKNYLNVLNDYFDIHATVPDATPSLLPRYVTNHKFLKPKKYQQLLSKARVSVFEESNRFATFEREKLVHISTRSGSFSKNVL